MRRQRRTFAYLLAGAPTAPAAVLLLLATVVALAACVVAVGIPVLSELLRAHRGLANVERRRAGLMLPDPVTSVTAVPGGPVRRLRTVARQTMTYRELGWLLAHGLLGLPLTAMLVAGWTLAISGLASGLGWWAFPRGDLQFFKPVVDWPAALPLIGVGLVSLAVCWWVLPLLAKGYAHWCRAWLTPSARERLSQRVEELSATRAGALDAHASELRRIERDLHDGIQARLVSVGIQLGVAQRQRDTDPGATEDLVDRARAGVEDALSELQHVVRGIFPPILADRGLVGALHALAADSAVPLTVDIAPVGSPPAAVEAAAYFVAAEALTNVARHSGADHARLRVEHARGALVVEVTDDGRGGADASRGTGIRGIRQRAEALDGGVEVTSPFGGPTRIRVELPCEC